MSRETVAMVIRGDIEGARKLVTSDERRATSEEVLARQQGEELTDVRRQVERLVREVELMRCELNEELAALRRAVARVRR